MTAWSLPKKVTIAGAASGKPNHIATIHTSKGAPKSARLDAAGVRKRASTKGDAIVEVKPGEAVTSVIVAWTVDRFVKVVKAVEEKTKKAKPSSPKKEEVKGKKVTKLAKAAKRVPAKKTSKSAKKSPTKKKQK